MYDPHTKDSRGFGFVMMMDADGAAKAIEELSGKEFMGKIMTVAHVSLRFRAQKLIVQLLTYTCSLHRLVELVPGLPPLEGTTDLPRLVITLQSTHALSYLLNSFTTSGSGE